MCGDVINYSGVDDAVEHNFDSGAQKQYQVYVFNFIIVVIIGSYLTILEMRIIY